MTGAARTAAGLAASAAAASVAFSRRWEKEWATNASEAWRRFSPFFRAPWWCLPLPAVPAQAGNAPHEGGNTGSATDLTQVGQGLHPQGLHGPEDGTLALPREGPPVDGL